MVYDSSQGDLGISKVELILFIYISNLGCVKHTQDRLLNLKGQCIVGSSPVSFHHVAQEEMCLKPSLDILQHKLLQPRSYNASAILKYVKKSWRIVEGMPMYKLQVPWTIIII